MTKLSCAVFVLALTTLTTEGMVVNGKGFIGDRVSCWLPIKSRGTGSLPNCPSGEELEHRLCYPDCKPGYHGRGPMCFPDDLSYSRGDGHLPGSGGCEEGTELEVINCYTKCKPGYHGVGPRCWTDLKPYGRTAGTVPKYCAKDDKEYEAGLCYDKCPESYKGVLNNCYKQECPKDFPYKCGFVCMKDELQCESTATTELSPLWEDCVYTE